MKKSGFFVAASAAVVSSYSSSSDSKIHFSRQFSCTTQTQEEQKQKQIKNSKSSDDKFAPRFDGLRFIETLVTAHR
ncbi:hypothetical protein DCAR_0418096 [Daucus carota subsp. sativus]|uniref:Uncharacterized protein n=1 Tax=Daucus carota subsp. sativus TaxID=79200 RepID=A0AAF0X183_DAUCS|nr:hypothetical protein DCAR_0418096 [Daucus carota subsp. sativus]